MILRSPKLPGKPPASDSIFEVSVYTYISSVGDSPSFQKLLLGIKILQFVSNLLFGTIWFDLSFFSSDYPAVLRTQRSQTGYFKIFKKLTLKAKTLLWDPTNSDH